MKKIKLDTITIHPTLHSLYNSYAFRKTLGDMTRINMDDFVGSQFLRPVHLVKNDQQSYFLISGFDDFIQFNRIEQQHIWAIIHSDSDAAKIEHTVWVNAVVQILQCPHRKTVLRDLHDVLNLANPAQLKSLIVNTSKRELMPYVEYLSNESRKSVRHQVKTQGR
ncbi:MAG: hypothetical protein IBX55_07695 [Methyloprofundus sp.]|nr:hypothetical protein [Methyloprofundus sp.]